MKILSTAPCRISLFGGGTDTEPYVSKRGGVVISMAINIRQHITMYSGDDLYEVKGTNIFPYKADPRFYYTILDQFGINDMHHTKLTCQFDGIIESGIGSSASAAVALTAACNKRLNLGLTTKQIAEKAWETEVHKLGLFGGKQDQYAASFGGFNIFNFTKDEVNVVPLEKKYAETLIPSMVLLYTGRNRQSSKVQEGLKNIKLSQIKALDKSKEILAKSIDYILKGDYGHVGFLLHEAWEAKKASNPGVSNSFIEEIYLRGLSYGAYGGKLLGSGGGGYMLFIVDPGAKKDFIRNMKLDHWDFDISMDGVQTREITNK